MHYLKNKQGLYLMQIDYKEFAFTTDKSQAIKFSSLAEVTDFKKRNQNFSHLQITF